MANKYSDREIPVNQEKESKRDHSLELVLFYGTSGSFVYSTYFCINRLVLVTTKKEMKRIHP
jgi:hypothetical protein